MKEVVKKVFIAGIAGMTALNSVPVNVLVHEVRAAETKELSGMIINNNELSVTKGKYYYNETTKKLLFSGDASFSLKVTDDVTSYSLDGINYSDVTDGVISLDGLTGDVSIILKRDSGEETVNLSDFFKLVYSEMESCVFVQGGPAVKKVRESFNGQIIKEYFVGEGIDICYNLTKDDGLDYSDYNIKVSVDGVEISSDYVSIEESEDSDYNLKVSLPTRNVLLGLDNNQGSFEISVTVADGVNDTASCTDNYNYDYKAPEVSIDSRYVIGTDGKVYMDDGDSVSFKASDGATGIKSVKIYNGTEELSYTENDGVYTIAKPEGVSSITPKFVVEDNGGNRAEYMLSDIDSSLDSDEVVFGMPEATFDVSVDGDQAGEWYSGTNAKLKVGIENAIGNITKVKYSVNGTDILEEDVNTTEYSKELSLADLVDDKGLAKVVITALDNSGNEFTYSDTYKYDGIYPKLTNYGISTENYKIVDNVLYALEDFQIVGEPGDSQSGLSSVVIKKDGVKVSDSLPYTVSEDGDYAVVLTDNAGNVTSYGLSGLIGSYVKGVVISNESPVLHIDDFTEESVDIDGVRWYRSLENLSFSVDSSQLNTVSVTLDGETDLQYDTEDSKNYSVSLKDLSDGKHTISIVVRNKNGLEESQSIEFAIDGTKPSYVTGKLNTAVYEKNDVVYFNNKLAVNFSSSDSQSGMEKYVLLDKEGKTVSESEDGSFVITESGEYSVYAVDKVGNASETVSLKEAVGLKSNTLVLDNNKPEISYAIPEDGYGDDKNIFSSHITTDISVADDSGLSLVSVYCNNSILFSKDVSGENEFKYSLDTRSLKALYNGMLEIKIIASDELGNSSSLDYVIYVDTSAPEVTDSSLSGEYIYDSGKLYFTSKPVLKVSYKDNLVGVDKYILVDEDGKELESADGTFNLDSGSYSLKVSDKLGNVSEEVSLKNLLGLESNTIVVDSDKPVIECKRPSGDLDGWFAEDVIYNATLTDNIGIREASVSVNGHTVDSVSYESDGTCSVDLKADTGSIEPLKNGAYNIEVTVKDFAGNTATWTDSIHVDKEAPSISKATLNIGFESREDGEYFKENPVLILEASDGSGIGIEEYVLLDKNGNVVDRDDKGVFILGTNEYSVRILDKLGNSVTKTLKELLDLNSNNVVIDNAAPVIECSRPEGDLDGWFNKDVEYVADISDSLGIYKASISINGTVVDSFAASDTKVLDKELRANTEGIKPVGYGTYNIVVKVEDYAGNTDEWSDTVYIDKEAPEFAEGSSISKGIERNYGVFFTAEPEVILKSDDSDGIGVKEYILLDKAGKEISRDVMGFTLGSGEYYVKVVDQLGNVSEAVSLKELLGLSSNIIVVDGEKPVIQCDRPEGDVNGWYAKDVEYSVDISDNEGIYSAEVFINGESVDKYTADAGNVVSRILKADTSKVNARSDGSYEITVRVYDNSGNYRDWSDTIYIDRTAPTVDKFVILADGYKEGSETKGSDKYGFYLDKATDVEIYVSDGEVSSGMKKIHYTLLDGKGNVIKNAEASINGGIAKITLPSDFKGFITAYASDNVGNNGSVNRPDGIISESSNLHINTADIDIELPETPYLDAKGHYLYNTGVSANAVISDKTSGLRKIEWGINDKTVGVVNISNDGKISGDTASVVNKDKNLVVDLEKALTISNNANNLNVWVKVTDRTGHVSETSRTISIDKDSPVIDVKYGETLESGYYDSNRTATITITERNFKASDVRLTGKYGQAGSWRNIGGDTWVCDITFSKDGVYQWGVEYTDLAGNKAKSYKSEEFTIDKTAPVFDVTFDNNDAQNDYYYKKGRTATIKVTEKNFDADLVRLNGDGSIVGWTHNGDVHTAHINFNRDGEYEFSIEMSDLAGNNSDVYESGKFVVDMTNPEMSFSGVKDNGAYSGDVKPVINISDTNFDYDRTEIVWKKDGKTIAVEGSSSISDDGMSLVLKNVSNKPEKDGIYTISVTVLDKAGNEITEDITYSVNRFGSTYSSSQFNDIVGKYLTKEQDIVISEINVNPLIKKQIKIVKNGASVTELKEGTDYTVSHVKVKGGWHQYTYTINKSLFEEDGKYEILLTSTDCAGNISQSQDEYRDYDFGFFIDKTAPVVQVVNLEGNGIYNATGIEAMLSVTDNLGVSNIKVFLNDREINLNNKDSDYTFSIPESNKLQDIKIVATDKAGNETVYELNNIMVSTNAFYRWLANKPLFYGTVAGVVGLLSIFLFILFGKRKKDDEESEERENN